MTIARRMSILPVSFVLMAGCDDPSAPLGGRALGVPSESTPRVGADCTVQFRRDVLGAATDLPVPPLTGSINGAEVAVSGRFLRMDDDWIVLEHVEGHQLWVPRAVVLLLRVQSP